MSVIAIFYILNATLLLLHEIESAYENEWELLKLPVKITGFLVLHVPIIIMLFYGLLEIERQTAAGSIIGIISGIGGLIPFLVHKVVLRRKGHFDKPVSNVLIYSNIVAGAVTAVLSMRFFL